MDFLLEIIFLQNKPLKIQAYSFDIDDVNNNIIK